jgi:peptidyl-dipeptidase A
MKLEFRDFVERHTARIESLEKGSALAYWNAAITGSGDDFKRYSELQIELERIYTGKEEFEYVKQVRESGQHEDARLARIAELLYLRYLGNQIYSSLLERIVDLSSRVENKFNVFRPVVDGKGVTLNEIYRILQEESDSDFRRAAWEASKEVGSLVSGDLLDLVRLRNEAAQKIGFENYYAMSLALGEQNESALEILFAELDELTREPFLEMKAELDGTLAKRYNIEAEDIQPWHYHDPFFQEAPQTDELELDRYYKGKDPVVLARRFFESIGMPVSDILERSDLYEKEGKNPHAFCTDIDRRGDVRILANMKDNLNWMETILHELGHGVYDIYVDRSLPYLLRTYPHLCTTEASAMYFGRLSHNPYWMKAALSLDDGEIETLHPMIKKRFRLKQLVFARWCQTMFHFERALYTDPVQDLDTLWWDTVERCQFVKRPQGRHGPDWAAKIHIVSSPVYYHNYMLGELIASQLQHFIATEILGGTDEESGIYGQKDVGRYFIDVVFRPGNTLKWDDHVERVTGEPLTARYFTEQFVKGA